jgi:hypothetical protein
VASQNSTFSLGLITLAAKLASNRKRKNHQYSEREALPSKVAYLRKQVWIDS